MKFFKEKNVSLVLGSGGARGLAHIGVIKAIEENGGNITEVIGCSIGSLIGGFYAKGELHLFEEWVSGLSQKDVFSLLDFTWASTGWVKGDRILNTVKSIVPDILIEDLEIDFKAISTNLSTQTDISIHLGSLYDAIRASIAIPGVITAVENDLGRLVDGGVLNPLPLSHVTNKENIVIAVNLDGPSENGPEVFKDDSTLSILQHSYSIMRNQISKLSIDLYKPDFVIQIPKDISGIWDYDKASFLIEKGNELANIEFNKI